MLFPSPPYNSEARCFRTSSGAIGLLLYAVYDVMFSGKAVTSLHIYSFENSLEFVFTAKLKLP